MVHASLRRTKLVYASLRRTSWSTLPGVCTALLSQAVEHPIGHYFAGSKTGEVKMCATSVAPPAGGVPGTAEVPFPRSMEAEVARLNRFLGFPGTQWGRSNRVPGNPRNRFNRVEPGVSREGGSGGDHKYQRGAAGEVATPLKWP